MLVEFCKWGNSLAVRIAPVGWIASKLKRQAALLFSIDVVWIQVRSPSSPSCLR